jgi:hypothetical protein
MRKTPHQLAKERREARSAIEREKDTIYYLDFIPKDGQPTGRTTLLNDPWCIVLAHNPRDNSQMIDDAVRRFEQNHKVDSWREVASQYKVSSFWYP